MSVNYFYLCQLKFELRLGIVHCKCLYMRIYPLLFSVHFYFTRTYVGHIWFCVSLQYISNLST